MWKERKKGGGKLLQIVANGNTSDNMKGPLYKYTYKTFSDVGLIVTHWLTKLNNAKYFIQNNSEKEMYKTKSSAVFRGIMVDTAHI